MKLASYATATIGIESAGIVPGQLLVSGSPMVCGTHSIYYLVPDGDQHKQLQVPVATEHSTHVCSLWLSGMAWAPYKLACVMRYEDTTLLHIQFLHPDWVGVRSWISLMTWMLLSRVQSLES